MGRKQKQRLGDYEGFTPFVRCGNSSFYQPYWQDAQDLEVTFVDPVDFVLVMSSETDDGLMVSRTHLRDLTPEMFQEYVDVLKAREPAVARLFMLWMAGLVTALEEREEFKPDLLKRMDNAKKDVRGKTIDAVEDFIIRNVDVTIDDDRTVEATPEALWEVLGEFGIHEC